jgi:hypothetical protein
LDSIVEHGIERRPRAAGGKRRNLETPMSKGARSVTCVAATWLHTFALNSCQMFRGVDAQDVFIGDLRRLYADEVRCQTGDLDQ